MITNNWFVDIIQAVKNSYQTTLYVIDCVCVSYAYMLGECVCICVRMFVYKHFKINMRVGNSICGM